MAENTVFRKVSLDRLSSPEDLDQRLTVTSPIGWVAFMAVALLVLAGLMWGILGSIANKAVGEGIIMSSGGVTSIIHHANGQITDVSVKDGDYVEKGDVIARVEQGGIIDEITKYKEDLAVIKSIDRDNPRLQSNMLNYNIYGKIIEISNDIQLARANLLVQRASSSLSELEDTNYQLEQAGLQYEESLENYTNYKYLYGQGKVSQDEFSAAERKFKLSNENLQALQTSAKLVAQSQIFQAELQLKLLLQQFKDTVLLFERDLENKISKMQNDLINNGEIVSNVSGRVLELQVKKGDMVAAGQSVCSIAQVKKSTETLEAIVYVPVEQGKKIMPGMEVNISPSTVKKEEDGYMLGNVVAVSQYPASAQGMLLTLGNPELVQRLSGRGAPIEVRVELIMNNSTVSGYKWSTPKGPSLVIDSGTLCVGEVKVAQQRPISMIVPFIKKVLPI